MVKRNRSLRELDGEEKPKEDASEKAKYSPKKQKQDTAKQPLLKLPNFPLRSKEDKKQKKAEPAKANSSPCTGSDGDGNDDENEDKSGSFSKKKNNTSANKSISNNNKKNKIPINNVKAAAANKVPVKPAAPSPPKLLVTNNKKDDKTAKAPPTKPTTPTINFGKPGISSKSPPTPGTNTKTNSNNKASKPANTTPAKSAATAPAKSNNHAPSGNNTKAPVAGATSNNTKTNTNNNNDTRNAQEDNSGKADNKRAPASNTQPNKNIAAKPTTLAKGVAASKPATTMGCSILGRGLTLVHKNKAPTVRFGKSGSVANNKKAATMPKPGRIAANQSYLNNNNSEPQITFLDLPFDITRQIVSKLTLKDILRCAQVCKFWASFWSQDAIWEKFCKERGFDKKAALLHQGQSWKKLYKILAPPTHEVCQKCGTDNLVVDWVVGECICQSCGIVQFSDSLERLRY